MKTKTSVLLGLLLLAAPATVQAQSGDDYDYTINPDNTNTITLTSYDGPGGALNIPCNINNLIVTGIAGDTFFGSGATSIVIPASVTSIADSAFSASSGLTAITVDAQNLFYSSTNGVLFDLSQTTLVEYPEGLGGSYTIPDGVIRIEDGAFAGNYGLSGVTIPASVTSIGDAAFEDTGLSTITLPASVTSIGNATFEDTGLASVTLPASVTCIGDNAFCNCTGLASVIISAGVTSIGDNAFGSCFSLPCVTIPASVTNIGVDAFGACFSLSAIAVDAQNLFYSSTNGVLFDKNQTTLLQYPGGLGGSYAIPNSVTRIEDGAFSSDFRLTGVTIPASVTYIGNSAFEDASLASVTIPPGVTCIADNAFAGNFSLTSATISAGVTRIGNGAFEDTGLTSVTIPASVTSIGDAAFAANFNLASVYFTGNAPIVVTDVFENDPVTVYYLPGAAGWCGFSATTSLAALPWNPLIQTGDGSFGVQNNQFGFNITGTNNFTVVVEACTNLTNPVWTPLQTVTLVNGSNYFSDPQWMNYPGRFYGLGLP